MKKIMMLIFFILLAFKINLINTCSTMLSTAKVTPAVTDLFNLILNKNYAKVVKFLFIHPDFINKTNGQETPLIYACRQGCKETVKLLLDLNADTKIINSDKKTALHVAIEKNNSFISKLLIENNPNLLEMQDENGNTPLLLAVENNNLAIVKMLIGAGVNINSRNRDGFRALTIARYKENKEIISLLIKHGALADNCIIL